MTYPWAAGEVLLAADLNSALAAKTDLAMAKNAQTGTSYSYALADQTKLLTMSNASANTVTVTKQATVAWAADTQLRVLNIGAGATTLVADTGVTINNNTALAQWRGGVLIRMSSDVWTFVPFASGVGAANFSDAATGTYTGYKYITFTASGTLTVTTAGFADIVVCGGGGSAGGALGGAGGAGGVLTASVYFPVGTYTCTVGAGGAGSGQGRPTPSGIFGTNASFIGLNGGSGNTASAADKSGGSGAGGMYAVAPYTAGLGQLGQGNNGGVGTASAGGGGGGAGAVGSAAVAGAGGAGGAGTTTSIAGTTPSSTYTAGSYALGGGGGGSGTGSDALGGSGGGGNGAYNNGVAGGANKGGGGGGSYNTNPGAGGSGIIIVRVAV